MKTISVLTAITLGFFVANPAAPAADKKKPAAATPAKNDGVKDEHYPLYGQVVSISAELLTIEGGEGKPDRKLDITKQTTIRKDDRPATVKDADEGQWVGGYVKRSRGDGNDQLVSLNLSAKQKEIKPAEKKPAPAPAPRKKKG